MALSHQGSRVQVSMIDLTSGGRDAVNVNNGPDGDDEDNENPGPAVPNIPSGDRAWRNRNKLVPQPDNEPALVCKLSGNTISGHTEICGWSFLMPTKFFGINPTLRMQSMVDGRGEICQAVEEIKAKAISLAEMETLIGGFNRMISSPVYVHVVAKRKVDVFPYNSKLMVIPLVVVADSSGYCVLCSFNEGLEKVYNEVEVGDKLLVTKCLPQVPRRTYHRGLFAEDMFLNLELKLQFLNVRNHYRWQFSPLKLTEFHMPSTLFDNFCQLRFPSELEAELSSTSNAPNLHALPVSDQYYDLIGVVTYVGRIERFQMQDAQDLECLENNQTVIKKVTRYIQYRWISIVDGSSQPFHVKVFVNNLTIAYQSILVPGAILVLSHCQTKECSVIGKFTATSNFSQMYLEGYVEKYFMLHPIFRDKALELMAKAEYVRILLRNDIQWSIGGTHVGKICNPETFLNSYRRDHQIPDDKPMMRRESKRFCFQGVILRVLLVNNENMPLPFFVQPIKYNLEKSKKENGHYKVTENFYPYTRFINSSWYAFRRKLPSYDPFILKESRCRDIVKRVTETYKPLCLPLLMPAEMPDYRETGPPPPMADLEKLDGPPYMLVDVVNEETRRWYTCIWKNTSFSIQEMKDKVNAAKSRQVTCVAEIFCTEPDAPLEVNLFDFVISN